MFKLTDLNEMKFEVFDTAGKSNNSVNGGNKYSLVRMVVSSSSPGILIDIVPFVYLDFTSLLPDKTIYTHRIASLTFLSDV